jgi:predicted lipoprotein with Yx(FWY)xxD motif
MFHEEEATMGRVFVAAALVLAITGCETISSMIGSSPAKERDGMLVGPNEMTLYTFDRDAPGSGKSVCTGKCAVNWPPLPADAKASAKGDWAIIARDDGSRQWAYKGKPLYYWIKDQKPGDKTGDGVNNVWRVARP